MSHDHDGECPGKGQDVMHLGPEVGRGFRPFVRHTPACRMKTGFVRPAQEGEVLLRGAVYLEHRKGGAYDVVAEVPPMAEEGASGPTRVATDEYRTGWDRIFGGSQVVGEA